MKRENELTIDLELTVKSPVHIGTGDTQVGNEYRIDGADAEAIDIPRYLDDNPGKAEDVISVMKDEMSMAGLPDVEESYARYPLRAWVDSESIRGSPVQVAIKGGTNTPYIPGSSLKGWLRTALAYRVLNQTKNADGTAAVADVRDEDSIVERFRVGDNDPKTDLMRCVTVRDAHPVSDSVLALCEIKTRRDKSAEDGDPSWMGFQNYAECLLPNHKIDSTHGNKFNTELKVDLQLLEKLVEFHNGRATARAVFGDDRTPAGILETIRDALQRFQEAVIDEERELFSDEKPLSENMLESFYTDRMERFYNDTPNDDVLFRVGAKTGQYSKTVIESLSQKKRILENLDENITHAKCGKEITATTNDDDEVVLVCEGDNCGEVEPTFEEIDRFPKTRRGVFRNGAAYYPLGWIEASLRGPL